MRYTNSIAVVFIRFCMSFFCGLVIYSAATLYIFRGKDVYTFINALKDLHPAAVIVGIMVFLIVFYLSGFSNEKNGAAF